MRRDTNPALCLTCSKRCFTEDNTLPLDKNLWELSGAVPGSWPLRYKLGALLLPLGYKIEADGVYVRHATRNGVTWKQVTRTPCIIAGISAVTEADTCRKVQIVFIDTMEQPRALWTTTQEAFSRKIAKTLLMFGCCCTEKEGGAIAEYFKECYILRAEEARKESEKSIFDF